MGDSLPRLTQADFIAFSPRVFQHSSVLLTFAVGWSAQVVASTKNENTLVVVIQARRARDARGYLGNPGRGRV